MFIKQCKAFLSVSPAQAMGMLNKHVGYLYLVDWQGKIRWASVGFAETQGAEDEVAGLRACVTVLLDRLKEGLPG